MFYSFTPSRLAWGFCDLTSGINNALTSLMLLCVDRWRQQLIIHCLFDSESCFNAILIRVRYVLGGDFFCKPPFMTLSLPFTQSSTMNLTGRNNVFQLPICHCFIVLCKIQHNTMSHSNDGHDEWKKSPLKHVIPPYTHDWVLNSRPWVLGQNSTAITIQDEFGSSRPV